MMIARLAAPQAGAEIFRHRFGQEAAVLVGLHDMVAVRGFAEHFVPVHLASFLPSSCASVGRITSGSSGLRR